MSVSTVVELSVVVEYIPERKQFIFDIVQRRSSLQQLTRDGTQNVQGTTALADMNADIFLRQPNRSNETVRYYLRHISLFDNSGIQIPTVGVLRINEWYYDALHREFATDHNFQIVVVRSEDAQECIDSFEERMEQLHNPPPQDEAEQCQRAKREQSQSSESEESQSSESEQSQSSESDE